MEHHRLINAVQKLRPEVPAEVRHGHLLHLLIRHLSLLGLQDVLTSDIRGHDQHRIFEVHGATMRVGESAVIHHLEQHIEHVMVRLLDFIEQNHGKRTTPDRLSELAAFLIPHIAGRSADEPSDGVLLHIFRHINANEIRFIIEECGSQGAGELCFPNAGWTEEQE